MTKTKNTLFTQLLCFGFYNHTCFLGFNLRESDAVLFIFLVDDYGYVLLQVLFYFPQNRKPSETIRL